MRSPTPREWALIAVMVVAGVGYFWLKGGGMGLGGRSAAEEQVASLGDPPRVRMDRLAHGPEPYDPQGRNLFDYGTPPSVKAQPRPQQDRPKPPPPRPRQDRPQPQPRQDRPKPQPATARPPKPDFEYLGFLGPKGRRIAVFEAEEDEMVLASVGDVVEQHFKVVEFKYETVVLGFTDDRFRDQTTELTIKGKK